MSEEETKALEFKKTFGKEPTPEELEEYMEEE